MPTEPVPEARSDGQGCHVLRAMAEPKHEAWTVSFWLCYRRQLPLNGHPPSSAVKTHQGGCEVGKAGQRREGKEELDVVAHTCHPSTQEAKGRGTSMILGPT